MEIHWRSEKLKKDLEDGPLLTRRYDERVAKKIAQRLRELADVPSYAQLPPSTGKHPVKEGKKTFYAVDVPGRGEARGKLRLLFQPVGDYDIAHVETITAVEIIQLIDYH